jgi:hypothetical protein
MPRRSGIATGRGPWVRDRNTIASKPATESMYSKMTVRYDWSGWNGGGAENGLQAAAEPRRVEDEVKTDRG